MDLFSAITVNIWLIAFMLISLLIPGMIIMRILRMFGKSARKTTTAFTRQR